MRCCSWDPPPSSKTLTCNSKLHNELEPVLSYVGKPYILNTWFNYNSYFGLPCKWLLETRAKLTLYLMRWYSWDPQHSSETLTCCSKLHNQLKPVLSYVEKPYVVNTLFNYNGSFHSPMQMGASFKLPFATTRGAKSYWVSPTGSTLIADFVLF